MIGGLIVYTAVGAKVRFRQTALTVFLKQNIMLNVALKIHFAYTVNTAYSARGGTTKNWHYSRFGTKSDITTRTRLWRSMGATSSSPRVQEQS